MAERLRSIFLTILSLTIIWLIIILLCLPQNDNIGDHWTSASAPQQSSFPKNNRRAIPDSQVNEENTIEVSQNIKKSRRSFNNDVLPPRQLDFMKYFQSSRHKDLNIEETLFYDFKSRVFPSFGTVGDSNYTRSISKSQHDRVMLELSAFNNPTDRYVKLEGDRLFAFNLLISNRIGLFRPLPDSRNERCHGNRHYLVTNTSQLIHDSPRPIPTNQNTVMKINLKTSIIICYFNEAPSALLRTINSVLIRSPQQLIKEIIVVDDSSTSEYHYAKIGKPYINSDLVTFIRTNKREGLIRARLFGARLAKGEVLIFLDSHVEANEGWLEPLLEAVQENKTTIACPMIDLINAETMLYSASPMVKGGLDWNMHFKWDSVPSDKLKTYDDFVKPIESPSMAGGLYAIDRDFFYHLGAYDSKMNLWGGENIELSLRTWMCGGRILILPCSRLGHIFRKKRPYGPEPNQPDSLLFNSYRTAKVWLGEEFMHKFHEAQPNAIQIDVGEVSERIELKKSLNCQNFSWFIDNVYPSLKVNLNEKNHKRADANQMRATNLFDVAADKLLDKASGDELQRVSKNTHETGQASSNRRPLRQVAQYYNNIHSLDSRRIVGKSGAGRQDYLQKSHRMKSRFYDIHQPRLPKKISQFQIQSANSNLCIESKSGYLAKGFTRLILDHCASTEHGHNSTKSDSPTKNILDQLWTETEVHDFRLGDNQCLDLIKNLPLLRKCHNMGSFQVWKTSHHYDVSNKIDNQSKISTNIYNLGGGLCLGVERLQVGEPIIVTICDTTVDEEEIDESSWAKKSPHRQKVVKLLPNWYTGSSFLTVHRLKARSGRKNLAISKPIQKWNLLFVDDIVDLDGSTTLAYTTTTLSSTTPSYPSATTLQTNTSFSLN